MEGSGCLPCNFDRLSASLTTTDQKFLAETLAVHGACRYSLRRGTRRPRRLYFVGPSHLGSRIRASGRVTNASRSSVGISTMIGKQSGCWPMCRLPYPQRGNSGLCRPIPSENGTSLKSSAKAHRPAVLTWTQSRRKPSVVSSAANRRLEVALPAPPVDPIGRKVSILSSVVAANSRH